MFSFACCYHHRFRYVFSTLTVGIVGTAFPVYESVRAVCTPQEDDDKEWLQYWMVAATSLLVTSSTSWVTDLIGYDELFKKASAFLFYWLYFPLTNGSLVIYENVTVKYIAPIVAPVQDKVDNLIRTLYSTTVNLLHVWIVWFVFLFLPGGIKRLVAVAVGTIYPFASSVGAAATDEVEDDSFWLTYWSCYGILFLLMDVL